MKIYPKPYAPIKDYFPKKNPVKNKQLKKAHITNSNNL